LRLRLIGCCGEQAREDVVDDPGEEGAGRVAVLEHDLVAEQAFAGWEEYRPPGGLGELSRGGLGEPRLRFCCGR
jgi:hypothetical protein